MKTLYQQPEIRILNMRVASTILSMSTHGVSTENYDGAKGTILSRESGSLWDDDEE